ncbi:hypothetical protein [Pedobacter nototheniae]|uniref:hypothetical protein n=1 Tax=Pedobacter nototheniae TaxID=2488994 RepID=UPI00103ABEA0|nr:hypothetical protein [Pedobacter nototheniae]
MGLIKITFPMMLVVLGFTAYAQETESNMRMLKPFKADGISNEWNEPLNEFNSDTKLAFALANDDQNLYIVIESLDPETTMKVLSGGITLNINTAGKKKTGIELTFPLRERPPIQPDNVEKANIMGADGKHEPHELPDEKTMGQGIKVTGFKNIPDGIVSPENSYGIKTGMVVKPNRDLIYEMAIPLSQLQVDLNLKKPIAYNIKINSFKRGTGKPGGMHDGGEHGKGGTMGGGRGGMGAGGGRMGGGGGGRGGQRPSGGENVVEQKSDFWIKYLLVKS